MYPGTLAHLKGWALKDRADRDVLSNKIYLRWKPGDKNRVRNQSRDNGANTEEHRCHGVIVKRRSRSTIIRNVEVADENAQKEWGKCRVYICRKGEYGQSKCTRKTARKKRWNLQPKRKKNCDLRQPCPKRLEKKKLRDDRTEKKIFTLQKMRVVMSCICLNSANQA